ncbi:Hint domain-containing protein [Alphaproteobacteria bacterium KMM 3653]|uniref:Hint domain-containing protein n=1 Tax=Harenicola maris TaxID=2841044 RepID=A0AAP2G376_9RHOB|nr:Hint domain-containing protein [Harenicola maris]
MPNVLLTFNDLSAGDIVAGQYSANGVTISSTSAANPPMVFDTSNPTGGDSDLATSNLGNVLIISEDGDSNDPDDNAGGGTFVFDFDAPTKVFNFNVLDTEEGGTVKLFDENGDLIQELSLTSVGNGQQGVMNVGVDGVASMEVTINGSGAIDNVCFEEPVVEAEGDGVVTGSNGDDYINAAYTGDPEGDMIDNNDALLPGEEGDDDIVDALGGDDTIKSGEGDDEVYAGSGNDTVDGGAGDDVIYGDSNYGGSGGTTVRESLNWSQENPSNGFTQDTGNVEVTFSVTREEGHANTGTETTDQYVSGIDTGDETINANSSLYSVTNGKGNDVDYKLEFSDPVENVEFRINDIDGDGKVKIKAYDADGNLIDVDLTGGSRLTLVDTDGQFGADKAVSEGGYAADDSPKYSLLVEIAGPVAKIVIEHDQFGYDNSGINVTDVYFDVAVGDDGAAGNDVLSGGDGNDIIYGEDGDDMIFGGNGNDTLVGGNGDDKIEASKGDDVVDGGAGNDDLWGGKGNDVVDGGSGDDVINGGDGADVLNGGDDADTIFAGAGDTVDGGAGGNDHDVLDLTGQGAFYLTDVVEDSNGNGIDGTVIFVDADGEPTGETLTFTEIEEVIGDEVNVGPDAEDDTAEVDEDESVVIDVLANDSDPNGDPLEVTGANADNGTVTVNADGTLTYEPNPDFNGTDTITYTVSDGNGGTATATVTVTVNPVNDDPVAVDDAAETDFDTAVTVNVLDNDTDVDGDDLTLVAASSPDGSVDFDADGNVTFTPNPGFEGDATITYTVSDGNGGTDEGTLTVTVAEQPLDGIVQGTDGDDLIDVNYTGDPQGDMVDNNDALLPGEVGDDDIILAGAGDDRVIAGEGNDEIYGGTGNDNISAGNGDDEIFGEDGDDMLFGGAGDDTIIGGEGDDKIEGSSGEDYIEGGAGNDDLWGGLDDDRIIGGDGDDVIAGGGGNDDIDGNEGNDTITGGAGNDTINGEAGDDVIDGGRGDDEILGGQGNDIIDGGDGDDIIDGMSGDDVITGGLGDDYINGGGGEDVIEGNEGDDTIIGHNNIDIIDGGEGDDTITGGGSADILTGGDGNDTVDGGAGDDVIDTRGNIETVLGVEVSGSPDLGYPGIWTPDADPNDDKDTVYGGAGNDTITTGDDADYIEGGSGDDIIDGGFDADTIYGGTGNDYIVGGEGSDEIYGGDGNDTIYAGLDPAFPDAINIPDDAGDLVTNNGQDFVDGGAGNDTIFGADDADTLLGGDGNDYIDGQIDDDYIDGGDGKDTLLGGDGDDTILGGAGNDTITGGAGVDTLSGGDDRDTFLGGNGGDTVDGGDGGDDYDTLDLTGSDVDFITYTSADQEDGVVTFGDGSTMTFEEIENVIPCFTPGTMIATPIGERKVEDLRAGDKVITRDNGIQTIAWYGATELDQVELIKRPHLKPILISAGALGNGLPERDMMVSPQHRVLVANEQTALYFEEREVLVAAKHLVGKPGIMEVDVPGTTYIHFMFQQHEVVLSDGAWTESFQPGDYTLEGIGEEAREEILELFPELATAEGRAAFTAARRTLKKHEAELLAHV